MTDEERAEAVIAGKWLTKSDLRDTLIAAFAAARVQALEDAAQWFLRDPQFNFDGEEVAAMIRAIAQPVSVEEPHDG